MISEQRCQELVYQVNNDFLGNSVQNVLNIKEKGWISPYLLLLRSLTYQNKTDIQTFAIRFFHVYPFINPMIKTVVSFLINLRLGHPISDNDRYLY